MLDPCSEPLFKIVNRDLLGAIMRRTGDGQAVSVRQLAERADVARSTIGNLLSGAQSAVGASGAHRIAHSLGVDVLVLFIPIGRSAPLAADAEGVEGGAAAAATAATPVERASTLTSSHK